MKTGLITYLVSFVSENNYYKANLHKLYNKHYKSLIQKAFIVYATISLFCFVTSFLWLYLYLICTSTLKKGLEVQNLRVNPFYFALNHSVSASHYLIKFTNGNLKFSELNETFCNDFKDYLLTTPTNKSSKAKLSQNSVVSYFNKVKAAMKQAYKDNYLQTDLNAKIEAVKQAETRRNFLTIDELNSLVKTECTIPILKQAALFSALTGLRFSDIQKLVWDEIEFIKGNGYFLKFKQQKTDGIEMMPISEQAFNLLGERKGSF